MLTPPTATPLPTFESFLAQRANEVAPSQVQTVAPILDEWHLELEASRLDANSRYSNPEDAAQCLYDWACRLLRRQMGREMDEKEQTYVRERCQ